MTTKDELEARNVELEADLAEARKGGDTAELKKRIATLEGAAGVDSTPPRESRPPEERSKRYGGALLKTALEHYPDPENYPDGKKVLSAAEQENIKLRRQVAEQEARQHAAAEMRKPSGGGDLMGPPPGPPNPPVGQHQVG